MLMIFNKKFLKNLWKQHFNLTKTLFLNFKVFKLADAIKLPVFLYGDITLEGLHKGCIQLESKKTRSVIIGGGWSTAIFGNAKLYRTFLRIPGHLKLGADVWICQGCILSVNKEAELHIGNDVRININTKIHAKEKIYIGDHCRIGWESQIFDTNFHYTINNGKIAKRTAPVVIEHNTWLANRVSVMKGTYLPAYSVVASNSVVSKNFREYGEKCLYGGTPAKYILKGVERFLTNGKVERIIDSFFEEGKDLLDFDDVKEKIDKKM